MADRAMKNQLRTYIQPAGPVTNQLIQTGEETSTKTVDITSKKVSNKKENEV